MAQACQVASTNGSVGLKSHAVLECRVCQTKEFKRSCAGLWNSKMGVCRPMESVCPCDGIRKTRVRVPAKGARVLGFEIQECVCRSKGVDVPVCGIVVEHCGTLNRCGTVTIFYGSGSGSDFWKVKVPVPVPTLEKLRFQFRFRFQLHI